jgi:pimeloyl-ACP methyl ester carboxylesterase
MTHILTLSGWTQPSDALKDIAPEAYHLDYGGARNVAEVAERLPQRDYDLIIGWSLGGIIARELMADHGLNTPAFVSIASPYQFVRTDAVNAAMSPDIFSQFYANYRDDTQRTVNRFHGLVAKGDRDSRRIMQALTHHPKVLEVDQWLPWMDFLESHSAAARDYSALPPSLILHGTEDAIVPYPQSHLLQQALPNTVHHSWEGAGHALHLHDAPRLRQEITDFYEQIHAS